MNRKTFIRTASASALISIPAVSLLSCSSSDDGSSPSNGNNNNNNNGNNNQANCVQNGTNNTISANHGHSLSVSKEDVTAGTEKTYTLSQGNGHTHEVTISKSQFETLQGNTQITATSTSDSGHTHNVTVSCA